MQHQRELDAQAAKYFDADYLPYLINGDELVLWTQKNDVKHSSDLIFADEATVTLAVDSTAQGLLFSLNSGDGLEEARISIEMNRIRFSHITDSANYSYFEVLIPSNIGSQFVISAAFGAEPNHISVQLNGKRTTGNFETRGSPFSFSFLQKNWSTGPTNGKVNEVMVHSYKLSSSEMNVASRHVAGNSGVHYVMFNTYTNIDDEIEFASEKFTKARAIMSAHCVSCHSNYGRMSERNFVQRDYITPKNPAASKLYYRLSGSLGSNADKDMPQNGTLSEADVQAIADWIQDLK